MGNPRLASVEPSSDFAMTRVRTLPIVSWIIESAIFSSLKVSMATSPSTSAAATLYLALNLPFRASSGS